MEGKTMEITLADGTKFEVAEDSSLAKRVKNAAEAAEEDRRLVFVQAAHRKFSAALKKVHKDDLTDEERASVMAYTFYARISVTIHQAETVPSKKVKYMPRGEREKN